MRLTRKPRSSVPSGDPLSGTDVRQTSATRPLRLLKKEESGSSALARAPNDIDRTALQWLLIAGLLAVIPLAPELPSWTSITFLTMVMWRYAVEHYHVYRPGRAVRYVLLAILSFGVFREFGSVFGRDPGLTLLIVLLGLKLLEMRNVRDAMLVLFLFYLVVAGGFLYTQTLPLGMWAIVTVTVSLVALLRLHQGFSIGAAFRLAGELLLKAVPLLILLYVLFPRVSGTLWGVAAARHSGVTGMPDEMSPGNINSLSSSSDIVLRIDFLNGPLPPMRDLYWRGRVLWESNGRTWKRGTPPWIPTAIQPLGAPVQYRVTLEPSDKSWLFALDLPTTSTERARLRPDFTLSDVESVRERTSYTLTSYTRYTTGPLSDSERRAALALPPLSERVRAFADELRARNDDVARVNAVLAHFRREKFVYTLTPPLLGSDPVDQFLFETQRGFCEHYTAAFVTLMRAAGVPARVVVGYQGGELNPAGNYLIVRQSDAHAWSEVWLPERGWVRIDPTSAIAPERVELGIEAIRRLEAQGLTPGAVATDVLARALELPWFESVVREVRMYWDYSNIAWYRWVVDYRKDRQESVLRALGFAKIEWTRILITLGGGCVLVLLAYVAWSRRAPSLDPAQRLYTRFCRKLARAGMQRTPCEGALDFAARVRLARPDLTPAVDQITARYLELRYGERSGKNDLREFAREVAAFRLR